MQFKIQLKVQSFDMFVLLQNMSDVVLYLCLVFYDMFSSLSQSNLYKSHYNIHKEPDILPNLCVL